MSVSVGGGRPDGALQSDKPRPDPGGAWFLVCSSAHRMHTRPTPPVRVVVVVVAVRRELTGRGVSRRPDPVKRDVALMWMLMFALAVTSSVTLSVTSTVTFTCALMITAWRRAGGGAVRRHREGEGAC